MTVLLQESDSNVAALDCATTSQVWQYYWDFDLREVSDVQVTVSASKRMGWALCEGAGPSITPASRCPISDTSNSRFASGLPPGTYSFVFINCGSGPGQISVTVETVSGPPTPPGGGGSDTGVLLGLTAIAAVGGGVWWYRRRQRSAPSTSAWRAEHRVGGRPRSRVEDLEPSPPPSPPRGAPWGKVVVGGAVVAGLATLAYVATRSDQGSSLPPASPLPVGDEGCCPPGELFVGMAGSAPVCQSPGLAGYDLPCPCGCTQAGQTICGGYTPIQGDWGCCPPGETECWSLFPPGSLAACQAKCGLNSLAICNGVCICGPWSTPPC